MRNTSAGTAATLWRRPPMALVPNMRRPRRYSSDIMASASPPILRFRTWRFTRPAAATASRHFTWDDGRDSTAFAAPGPASASRMSMIFCFLVRPVMPSDPATFVT